MPRVQLPIVHLENVSTLGPGACTRPLLIDRVPEPYETDVPANSQIIIRIVDVGTAGLATSTIVSVTTVGQGTVVAFTQGVGFSARYSGSSFAIANSIGSSVNDEQTVILIRDTPFASEEIVTVRVQAGTTDAKTIDQSYYFQIEDDTAPALLNVITVGLKTLLVTFVEPVLQNSSIYSSTRIREITGRISFIAPDFIDAERGLFTTSSISDFICVIDADNAVNNEYFEISNTISAQEVTTVEDTVQTEDANLIAQAWTGPYKLVPIMEPERLIPSFTPAITGVTIVDNSTIQLSLDQELSPGRPYTLVAHNIGDLATPVNIAHEITCDFTAETFSIVPRRNFRLWEDLTPDINKRQDTSGDNQRFVRCLDEVTKILFSDVDRFGDLYNIDITPALDPLLVHLGNPFSFVDDDLLKRKTIAGLIQTFKDSGIDRGIENAAKFFLGVDIVVRPFNLLEGWVLGVSSLGDDTILGTDSKFLLYSFEIASADVLTDQEQIIITEITNIIKTAHTHFIRFVVDATL